MRRKAEKMRMDLKGEKDIATTIYVYTYKFICIHKYI
jgi:hypothetical protein